MTWRLRTVPIRYLAILVGALLCGCQIKNQIYRPVGFAPQADRSEITVPLGPLAPTQSAAAWPPHPEIPCDRNNLAARPCLAFLEFDDFGEVWQRSPSGRPTQLQHIITLISAAKKQDPQGAPLIITFLHGWKHNASAGDKSGGDDPNIIGFAKVLDQLKQDRPKEKVIIGIYLSWRGGLISSYWPVSQQLTYWNREATAARVGNTSLTEALIEISDATRYQLKCSTCKPILVFVGHSFGALALERALSQAMIMRLERAWEDEVAKQQYAVSYPSQRIPVEPLANLVIFINSAAAATESKQLMDYLASSQYIYRPDNEHDQPLLLSVTSEADLATGLALKIGHAVPLLGFKWNGSMRPKSTGQSPNEPSADFARACFEPPPPNNAGKAAKSTRRLDLSQSDYFMSTAGHLQPLWSHVTVAEKASGPQVTPLCELSRSDPSIYMTCRMANFNYTVKPVPGRCNGTPYWVMEVPKEIVPDHGTIFTQRLLAFLMPFIQSTEERTTLTRPIEAQ